MVQADAPGSRGRAPARRDREGWLFSSNQLPENALLRVTPVRWGPVATGGFPARLAD